MKVQLSNSQFEDHLKQAKYSICINPLEDKKSVELYHESYYLNIDIQYNTDGYYKSSTYFDPVYSDCWVDSFSIIGYSFIEDESDIYLTNDQILMLEKHFKNNYEFI